MLPEQGVALVQLIKAFPRPRPSGRTRRCSQPGSERAGGGPNFGPKRPNTGRHETGLDRAPNRSKMLKRNTFRHRMGPSCLQMTDR
jgi:hypothetical protein